MPIAVEVVTQEKLIFSEPEADMVVIPGIEGEMGVLPHHAPVLTTLGYGELTVRKGRAEEHFVIYGGWWMCARTRWWCWPTWPKTPTG